MKKVKRIYIRPDLEFDLIPHKEDLCSTLLGNYGMFLKWLFFKVVIMYEVKKEEKTQTMISIS
jgi:hypothetical protein